MNRLTDGRRALEPTSIDKLKPGERWSSNDAARMSAPYFEGMRIPLQYDNVGRNYWTRVEHCRHYVKIFNHYWTCKDCGTRL
jgi:hypothetical protein